MTLILSFDVDIADTEKYSLNDKQKQLLKDFKAASDKPLAGARWFTTSEETYEAMMQVKNLKEE